MRAERVLDGDPQQAGELGGGGEHLAPGAAVGEHPLGVGLLEEAGADLAGRDVRGEREDGQAAALGVVEALDQVGVAGAAGAGADGQPAAELGLGGGREGAGLLVAHVHPADALGPADRVHDGVEAVADDAVDPLHAGLPEHLHHLFGHARHE